jgi:hypothetical protein
MLAAAAEQASMEVAHVPSGDTAAEGTSDSTQVR